MPYGSTCGPFDDPDAELPWKIRMARQQICLRTERVEFRQDPQSCCNEERGFNDCKIDIEEGTAGKQYVFVSNKLSPIAVKLQ